MKGLSCDEVLSDLHEDANACGGANTTCVRARTFGIQRVTSPIHRKPYKVTNISTSKSNSSGLRSLAPCLMFVGTQDFKLININYFTNYYEVAITVVDGIL